MLKLNVPKSSTLSVIPYRFRGIFQGKVWKYECYLKENFHLACPFGVINWTWILSLPALLEAAEWRRQWLNENTEPEQGVKGSGLGWTVRVKWETDWEQIGQIKGDLAVELSNINLISLSYLRLSSVRGFNTCFQTTYSIFFIFTKKTLTSVFRDANVRILTLKRSPCVETIFQHIKYF